MTTSTTSVTPDLIRYMANASTLLFRPRSW